MPRLLQITLGGIDRGNQGDPDFPAEIFQAVIFRVGDGIGLDQQQKPITGLIGFLQRDLQLGYEIRLAVGILRLVDIRADAGSRSADLIADDRFVLILEKFDKIEYLNGESDRYIGEFVGVFFHWRESFRN